MLFINLAFGRNLYISIALGVKFLDVLLFIDSDSCSDLKNTSWLSFVLFFVLLLAVLLIFGVSFGLCNGWRLSFLNRAVVLVLCLLL